MQPIPFQENTDVAPIPFERKHLHMARDLKKRGLAWKPHVGCFVWDHQELIEVKSPFPMRVYFLLSLPRFIAIFGSLEAVAEKLVWVPTWHQARLLAVRLGVSEKGIIGLWNHDSASTPGDELDGLYRLILEAL
jgi:hypothetical protein